MRAKILLFSVATALLFAGCNPFNDEFKTTSPGVMSGEWTCFTEHYPGTALEFTTTNNNNDQSGKMLLNDLGSFWTFIAEVDISADAMTFSTPADGVKSKSVSVEAGELVPYDIIIKVTNGEVIRDALTLPSKSVVDVIEFSVYFEDDDPAFGTEYKVKGYRKTGFPEDAEYDPEFTF